MGLLNNYIQDYEEPETCGICGEEPKGNDELVLIHLENPPRNRLACNKCRRRHYGEED